MVELGENRLDLAGVAERALGFPDDDPRPATILVRELSQEARRLLSLGPRQGPGGVLVVDDSDDLRPACDQCVRDVQLPAQTLFGVLLVSSRGPGVCHQRREGCTLSHATFSSLWVLSD